MTKKTKAQPAKKYPNDIDTVASMQAELAEAIGLLRPHYPNASDRELCLMADALRDRRWRMGRWPTEDEL
jgi:hypothetical protein